MGGANPGLDPVCTDGEGTEHPGVIALCFLAVEDVSSGLGPLSLAFPPRLTVPLTVSKNEPLTLTVTAREFYHSNRN